MLQQKCLGCNSTVYLESIISVIEPEPNKVAAFMQVLEPDGTIDIASIVWDNAFLIDNHERKMVVVKDCYRCRKG